VKPNATVTVIVAAQRRELDPVVSWNPVRIEHPSQLIEIIIVSDGSIEQRRNWSAAWRRPRGTHPHASGGRQPL